MDFSQDYTAAFEEPKVTSIPMQYQHFKESKFFKPDVVQLLKNELAKTWSFYSQSYYRVDLKRVCEMEEQVHEWVMLPTKPSEADQRQQALIENGFHDILDQQEELQHIFRCYHDYKESNSNLELTRMFIGGAEPLRVLKLEFTAKMPKG